MAGMKEPSVPRNAGALALCWAILVVFAYCALPEHVRKYSIALDGLRLWSGAPIRMSGILAALPGHLQALAALALGLALAWFAGAVPAAWFRTGSAPLRAGLGLGIASLGMLGGGLVGLVFPALLVSVAVLLAATAWTVRRKSTPAPSRLRDIEPPPLLSAWVAWGAAVLAVMSFLLTAFGALAPETGYDSLIQHLADPRSHLRWHRIAFNDLSFLAQHPAGVEMLYMWLLPLGGDTAARLMHVALGVMSAWAFWHWVRARRSSRDATLFACVLYLTPFTGILSARSYIDNGLIFYGVLSLVASPGSWLQGAMVGLAIGTKYLGGFFLAGWVVALAATGSWKGVGRLAVAASLAGGWWGARNILNTGNLVYPFAFGLFGGIGWDARSNGEYTGELSSYGRADGLADKLAIPWLVTVNDRGALDDGSLGPLYLALAPLLLLCRPLPPGYRLYFWNAMALWVFWFFSPRQVRYALPLIPPFLALLVPAVASAARRWPQALGGVGLVLGGTLILQALLSFEAIYVWINPIYVAAGALSRPAYLMSIIEPRDQKTGRSLYIEEAVRLAKLLPPSARVYVTGDAKVYFMEGDYVVNALFNPPLVARIIRSSRTADEAAKKFRQRGITHLLYNVGGSIHIEYTHRLFSWNDRELAVLENLFLRHLKELDRLIDSGGDPMYILFELRPGRWPDPPYLPGMDARQVFLENAVREARKEDIMKESGALRAEYHSSAWLGRWLDRALRPSRRAD